MTVTHKRVGQSLAVTAAALLSACASTDTQVSSSEKVECLGANSCRGHSACATANSACKGKNDCKGQGYLLISAEQCAEKGGTIAN